jgi:ribosome-associated protein
LNDSSTEPFSTEEDTSNLPGWHAAAWAAEDKKATDIRVLDLTEVTTFADTFLICTASNSRQAQAITDGIQQALKKQGEPAVSIEGYEQGEWILSDYADLIVHVFSEKAREFYDLDRLWRQAKPIEVPANPDKREELPFSMGLPPALAAAVEDSTLETTPIPED